MQKSSEGENSPDSEAVLLCENVTKIWDGGANGRSPYGATAGAGATWFGSLGARLRNLRQSFSLHHPTPSVLAVDNLSLSIKRGELFVIIGPSGCGKTTLLKMLGGLIFPDAGRVSLNGVRVSGADPECVLISQEPPLFPWLTARKNVELMLKLRRGESAGGANGGGRASTSNAPPDVGKRRRVGSEERKKKVGQILRQVGLIDFGNAFPHQLSGGMQQRVALSCALVVEPEVILLDEPFGALDAQTRWLMQQFLYNVWEKARVTMVMVTHQIDEALFLADRILVMTRRPGRVKKLITVPLKRPRDRFSQEFGSLREEVFNLLREEVGYEQIKGETG
jgi:NitT/TauT family transport system ATP-binding protein